ncbi:MAG: hypothetical protein WAW85_09265 [Gordonia sp. (in: high G+C Gram-positive bacteria)]|uniref:hypothetical protein n=1 Tax=Gordonia sp. (in: high G+C Gram-positive bacteria) TaxID=84139 RepID=UPI003BB62A03
MPEGYASIGRWCSGTGWRRTELSCDRADDGRGLRAVFADGADRRRLIVVVTALRDGADRDSVAQSLANRIAQRGDDVVVEFAPASSYGGREVISYREAPRIGSGDPLVRAGRRRPAGERRLPERQRCRTDRRCLRAGHGFRQHRPMTGDYVAIHFVWTLC